MPQKLPLLLASLSPLAAAQSPFLPPELLTTSIEAAESMITADFTGDGINDVVVAGDGLVLLRSLGTAGLGLAKPVVVSGQAQDVRAISAGDLDGNGVQDLIAVQTLTDMAGVETHSLVTYTNNGSGSFTRRVLMADSPASNHVQLGDVDGDGDNDFILDRTSFGDVVWYENVQGDVGSPANSISNILSRRSRIEDANEDGLPDLIFEDALTQQMAVVLATSPGVFSIPQRLLVSSGTQRSGRLTDLDGDGDLDAVFTTSSGLFVAYATSPLRFQTPVALTIGLDSSAAFISAVLDHDGDGLVDISYTDSGIDPFQLRTNWLAGEAGGRFAAPQSVTQGPFGAPLVDLISDITGDGLVEGLTLRASGFTVYRNQFPSRDPLLGVSFVTALRTASLRDVATLDVDQDGDLDAVGLREESPSLSILDNDGTGLLTESGLIAFTGARGKSVSAHDFDQDGDKDLLIVAGTAGIDALLILRNDSGGVFEQVPIYTPKAGINDPQVGDVDGDGDLDIVVASGGSTAPLRWLRNESPSLSFTEILLDMPRGTTLGDVDDDGMLDFVAVRLSNVTQSRAVVWIRNMGGGTFAPEAALLTAFGDSTVSLSDVNGDGKTDILLNQGNPIFVATAITAGSQYGLLTSLGVFSPEPSQRLTSKDLNADGRLDLVMYQDFSFGHLWINPGGGLSTGSSPIFPMVSISHMVRFADLDNDGDLDALGVSGRELWLSSNGTSRPIGTNVCGPANPTSTGSPARMAADGSLDLADMDVTLIAEGMPNNLTGIFLVSRTVGAPQPLMGSQGSLCLTGAIGRFNLPMEILNSGSDGSMRLALDVNFIPQGNARIPLMAGETWHFQAWFRDSVFPTGATSNLTDAISLTF